jgi:hypothetical protein
MVQSRKHITKSKTIWFSVMLVVLGAIMDNFSSLQSIVPEHLYGLSYVIIGVIVALLRFRTSQPI